MKLYILNGPEKARSFELKPEINIVGRSKATDVQIKDTSVSRNHLKIILRGKKIIIEDLNSVNGTCVDGIHIYPEKEIEVKPGVPISLGNVYFSIGTMWSGDELPAQEASDYSYESIDPKELHKNRPMTNPKNLELIYKVSNVLMQSLNINETLEKILDYIFELLKRIDRGAVILINHETREILEVISRAKKSKDDATMMYSKSIVDRVIQQGNPIIMSDTSKTEDGERSDSMELMKIRSVMCVPLVSKSQMRGVIYVDSIKKAFGFRKEDLALLTALSSPAAIAIENALLYSDLERIIEKRTESLRETEEKLRESEARFKAVFNNMSSGVVVYQALNDGADFIILDVNKADQKIEKIKRNKKLRKSLLDISPGFKEINLALLEILKRVWETGKPESRNITLTNGEGITLSREYYVYRLPSGEIVAIYDDVTDKKKTEAEQKALQNQLFHSQKMESIGAFAGGTAHNFRNILQAILGNIEYIEMMNADNEEITELAKSVYDSVEKGVDLINNLLHFSKRNGKYQVTEVDLAEVIKEAYDIIEKLFEKNIDIKLNLEKDLLIKGNGSLLSQVFMNLFSNARDAMPDGGKLIIETKKTKHKVVAIVSDTGHGMDEETMERIFDPFFTLKEAGKGTGLGLSTTHGIVEQHKGTISVKSKPGRGSTFTISFPALDVEKSKEAKPQNDPIFGKGEKILIIDDEHPSLEAISNLTQSLGYKTISFDRPAEALKNYKEWAPDAVLIDRSMPEMDGGTCIKEIMKIDPKAKTIIVSGYEESGPDGVDENIKPLINGYLTKPFGLVELSRTLSRVLSA
jgi:signal transduction histidine kinase